MKTKQYRRTHIEQFPSDRMDDIESILMSILNSQQPQLPLSCLSDILTEANLWSLLSSIDQSFFPAHLFAQYVFSFESIVRLMVQFAYTVCKMTVNNRFSCNLVSDRLPENVAKFVLFVAVHSDKRQQFVESILYMSEMAQHEAMMAIEGTRRQVLENDVAEVLAKVSHYEALLEQETRKVHERDQEIAKLTNQLTALTNVNKDLKKKLTIMEEEEREAIEELDASSLDAAVHVHNMTKKERDQYQRQVKEKDEELDFLKERYNDAISKIQDLEEDISTIKENRQSSLENRQSFENTLQTKQQSQICKRIQRMSMRQDNLRLEVMHAKKMSQKQKLRADQRSEQLTQLYKHMRLFEKKIKKIKTQRNPQLDSMIRSQNNI